MGDWLSCKDLQLHTFSLCLTRLVHFLLKHFSWKERRQGEQSNLQNLWIHPCMWSMSWALMHLMKFPEHGILVSVGRKSINASHGWLLPACITNSSFIEITLCLLSHFPSFSLQCFIGASCLFLVITSDCYGLYVVCNCRRFNHEMMPVCFDSHCISAKVLYANWKSLCFVIKSAGAHLSASFTSMFLKQKVPLNLNAAL